MEGSKEDKKSVKDHISKEELESANGGAEKTFKQQIMKRMMKSDRRFILPRRMPHPGEHLDNLGNMKPLLKIGQSSLAFLWKTTSNILIQRNSR